MKASILSFFGICITLLLFSCGEKEEEVVEEKSSSSATVKHVHDWTPTDPVLLSGKKIYVQECSMCHDEGEEGAPELSDADKWKKRESKGLVVLLDHAINGFQGEDGEMPAKGGSEYLTDDEVTSAVKFMLATPKP